MQRITILAAVLAVILTAWAYAVFGGVNTTALRTVQAYVSPELDPQQSLGTLFSSHPHLTAEWVASWGGDEYFASVILRAPMFSDLDAACPKLFNPVRALVGHDSRLKEVARDQPIAVEIVFEVKTEDAGPKIIWYQSRMIEVWAEMKPANVAEYEKGLEETIAESDQRSLVKHLRLRHEGDRALLDIGRMNPTLAAIGVGSVLDTARQITAWK